MAEKKPIRKKKSYGRGVASVLSEQEKVAVHLYIKHGSRTGPAKIAEALEVSLDVAKALLKQTRCANYIQTYNLTFLKHMARYELSQVTKYAVTREDIIGRLYMLALVPPDETKGTIEGQVEAMNAIIDLLGLKFSPRDADSYFKDKTAEQLRHYALHGKFDPDEPVPQS
jgi:hypothetical protein